MAWGRDGRDSRNIKLGLTVLISPSCRQPCQLLGSNQRFKSACQHRCTHTPSTSHRQTCTCDCLCPIWGGRAGLHQLEAVGIPVQLKSNYTGNFFLTPENGSFGSRVIPSNSLLGRSFEELGKSQGTEAKPLKQGQRCWKKHSDQPEDISPPHLLTKTSTPPVHSLSHVPSC